MGWKTNRSAVITNRGAEFKIMLLKVGEVEGKWRLIQQERIVGGIPVRTVEQVYDYDEGTEAWRELVEKAAALDYNHLDAKGAEIVAHFEAES